MLSEGPSEEVPKRMHILRCFCPRGQSKYYTVILFSRPHNNNTAAIIMPLHYCITSYIIVYYIYISIVEQ